MKRPLSLLVLVVMFAVLLAACGGQPATPPAAPATAVPEEETTGADDGTAPTLVGTIKIASQSPLSGPQAALGTGIRNGAELGISQLAGPLTQLGFSVELAPFDDQARAEVGSANAKNIVSDGDILCVVGHLNSGVALAALPDYKNASLPMMSPANTSPDITEGGYEVAFRIVGRDDVQGTVGEAFAREELGVESVYIIHDTTAYGQGVAEFFRQAAEENGLDVRGFEGTEEKNDFSAILTPILAEDPDLIFFGGIYDQAGPLFAQARERGIMAQFLGPDGLDSPVLAELAGDAVDGMYYTSVAAPVSQFPDAAQFATDYMAAYGAAAPPFSAQAYDSAGLCIQAIAAAAEAAGDVPTREQVLEAMRNLPTYDGITGSYSFNANGDPDPATYFVLQANIADWNANELVSRLEISPPGSETTAPATMPTEEAIDEAVEEEEEDEAEPEATGDDASDYATLIGALLADLPADLGTIKIASQSPLSGPQAALGTGIRNGAELGIEQINELLADAGVEFELAPFDDQARAEVGSANAKNIVSDGDILCVVGHLNSGVALAALPDYKNASLPMMSPANTSPDITEGGYEVAFRIVGRDDVQGTVGEAFAREELGVESVYIIHDTTAYGQGVAEFFRQAAEANGLEVRGFEGTEEKNDFSAILTPILAEDPDLIFFGGIYDQAGPLFAQARERGITAQFLGPDGLDSPVLAELAGDAVDGMYYTSVAAPVSQFPNAAQFATDYQTAYGAAAPPFSAQAYDSSALCAVAVLQAAVDADDLPTREQVLEAMRGLPPFAGITGDYSFNANGDPDPATYFVLQANIADWNANELVSRLEIAPPR
ncbi:branched-chain amino acid ABC transporter substrate-binding protein [Candidatus Viridilinea mediisalina]|uniref:Branched chain amino acid ABC transporter substrate-binding protein n=1 Tax=Candidatus Viridilinea mediisalina TaxID=2024553 RepID=A0A2A6RH99_9CHLR|nr:branched-chain amino acid ABC transporter substrate-binding protein [Candidatus Viridilinea mediisalina]PDW02220.1 branched chain amino acid ABC transporter substrate-binding protein [Candidatus Viridilinea mediisalina]